MQDISLPKSFTVSRERWLRGEGPNESRLLRGRDNKMCCLGFLAIACGYTEMEIMNVGKPADLALKFHKRPPELVTPAGETTPICRFIMNENDSMGKEDDEREEYLKKMFKEINVEINFA